jgi:hypothetical protein
MFTWFHHVFPSILLASSGRRSVAGGIGFAEAEKLFRFDVEVPRSEEVPKSDGRNAAVEIHNASHYSSEDYTHNQIHIMDNGYIYIIIYYYIIYIYYIIILYIYYIYMLFIILYIYICTCCICVYTYASTFAIRMHLHVIFTLQWYWWWADVRQEEPPPDGEEVEPTPPKMERRLNEETCPAYVLLPWWRNGESGFHGFESPCWSMLYHFMDFYICFYYNGYWHILL